MAKKNVGRMFANEIRYGESIANSQAGSSGAIRPQDPINWVRESSQTGTPFPYDQTVSQAQMMRNSNALKPLNGIQTSKNSLHGLFDFSPDLTTFIKKIGVPVNDPINSGVVRPNTPGSAISPYDIGSGKVVPVNDPSYDPNLDPDSPLYDNLKGEVDKQLQGGGFLDQFLDHYKNAGQNIALTGLAIGIILIGGYAILK